MTRWSSPRPPRTAGGLCIKSESGDYSFERTMYASATPWKQTNPRPSSGSRIAFLRPLEVQISRTTKYPRARSAKFPLRRETLAEPGCSSRAYHLTVGPGSPGRHRPSERVFFSGSSENPPFRPNPARPGAGAPGADAAEALYGAGRICGVPAWRVGGPDWSAAGASN